MPKVLRDYEVYLVYIDPDRCDSCEQCLIMCPTDVFEMPHKAIAAGRRAAISIDQYLGGDGKIEVGINESGNGYDGGRESGFAELKRVEVPSLPLSERHVGFREVELCFTDEQVKQETHRCLRCDLEICLAKAQKGS